MTVDSLLEGILIRLRDGDPAALPDLASLARENPNRPEPWAHWAWNAYCRGQFEAAREAAEHLVTIHSAPDVYHLLSKIHLDLENEAESRQYLRRAMEMSPEASALRMEWIESLLFFHRPYTAFREYWRLRWRTRSQAPLPARLPVRILAEAGLHAFWKVAGVSSLGERWIRRMYDFLLRKGRYGAAYLLAKGSASGSASSGIWAERAADCLYAKRDFFFPRFEEETAWRRRAWRDNRPQSREKLARVLLHAGQAQSALDLLRREPPADALGRETAAHALAALRQTEAARDRYLELGEDNPIHYLNAGICALFLTNGADALADFSRAEECLPGHPLVEFLREACRRTGEYGVRPNAEGLDRLLQDLAIQYRWTERISEPDRDWESASEHLLRTHRYRLIPCPHCLSCSFSPTYLDPMNRWVRGKCDSCGFLFANPQIKPGFIADLYRNKASQASSLHRFFRKNLDDLAALPPEEVAAGLQRQERFWEPEFFLSQFEAERGEGRSMLDLGCSVGALMYQYRCRGWHTAGIDLDPHAVQTAQSRGLDARTASWEEAPWEPASFDLITLMDVIEHVPEYKPLLAKLYSLLKPGGLVKIKTPCAESVIHYTYGSSWISNDTHLVYFSRRILLDALRQAGFKVAATRSYLEANKLAHTYAHWREQNFTPLLDQLIQEWDSGDTITVLAKKPGTD